MQKNDNYIFNNPDYFSDKKKTWDFIYKIYNGRSNLRFLEIGCDEGRSTVWFLNNILNSANCKIICIDPDYSPNFINNVKNFKNIEILKLESINALSKMLYINKENSFDFIYIDGSHTPQNKFEDAVLSFRLLKPGGILLFDDYELTNIQYIKNWKIKLPDNIDNTNYLPKKSIEYFYQIYKDMVIKINDVHPYQFCVVKKFTSLELALIDKYGTEIDLPEWVFHYLRKKEKEYKQFNRAMEYIK